MLMSGNTPICRIALYALIRQTCGMSGGWVYIMTNRPDGTLYIGVTADLARRAFQHRECMVEGFTKDYRLRMLVWTEWHDDIQVAIQREKTMKHWQRAWKVALIIKDNPNWADLYDSLNK
jgi:putative endonuclease